MAPNIYCCGAGTAADTEAVTGTFRIIFRCSVVLALCRTLYLNTGCIISYRFSPFLTLLKLMQSYGVCICLDMVSSQLQLHRYHTGRESRVVTALTLLKKHLFKLSFSCFKHVWFSMYLFLVSVYSWLLNVLSSYQGHVSAALVLGGVDCTGPHLHTVSFFYLRGICMGNIFLACTILWYLANKMAYFADISPWVNWHFAICYNGFWFSRCNVCFWIKVQRRP